MSTLIYLIMMSFLVSSAVPPRQPIENQKSSKYLREGQFYGGSFGRGYSLLSVRRKLSKNKTVDRLIFDFGDLLMKPLKNKQPYVHVSVEGKKNRFAIDFFQTHRSNYNFKAIRSRLLSSPFIQSSEVILDSDSGDLSLVMTTSRPIKVEAFFMKSNKKPTRLVVDLVAIKK